MIPLQMAMWQRERDGHPVVAGTLIHHSDAGNQPASIRLTEHLDTAKIAASIDPVQNAYDNAHGKWQRPVQDRVRRTNIFHTGGYKHSAMSNSHHLGWSNGTIIDVFTRRSVVTPLQAEQSCNAPTRRSGQHRGRQRTRADSAPLSCRARRRTVVQPLRQVGEERSAVEIEGAEDRARSGLAL